MKMEANKRTLTIFLKTGFVEGISYLVLLGIAMPLKYIANMPTPVRIVGMIHGILFVAYCILLLKATIEYKWGIKKLAIGFLLSLFPFGTFFLDRTLKKES